jgi:CheY-like chemotaxis protein
VARAPHRHRCSVLVVDDDREVHEVLRVALGASGYDVACVDNARDGLDYLRSHVNTCVVLLDLMLAGMDGAGFRRAQLLDRSLAWIPVVLLSAAVDVTHQAAEMGARLVLRKPLDLDDLRRVVADATRICRNRPISDELATPEARPVSSG